MVTNRNWKKSTAVTACTLLSLAGLAVPVFGVPLDNSIEGENNFLVVNAGAQGDTVGIICGYTGASGEIIGQNTVGPGATVKATAAGQTPSHTTSVGPVPVTDPVPPASDARHRNICTGGFVDDYTGSLSSGAWFRVLNRDYVWNGCDRTRLKDVCGENGPLSSTEATVPDAITTTISKTWDGVDNAANTGLGSAGLARIQMEGTGTPAAAGWTCVQTFAAGGGGLTTYPAGAVAPTGSAGACRHRSDTVTYVWNAITFGYCGEGGRKTDAGVLSSTYPSTAGNAAITTLSRQVQNFQLSPVLYGPNCLGIPEEGTVRNAYSLATGIINGVVCNTTPDDDVVPGVPPPIVCFFRQLPSDNDVCMPAPGAGSDRIAVLALVGESGWDATEPYCTSQTAGVNDPPEGIGPVRGTGTTIIVSPLLRMCVAVQGVGTVNVGQYC